MQIIYKKIKSEEISQKVNKPNIMYDASSNKERR